MPGKGRSCRAENNQTLLTVCGSRGRSLPTEVGHARPLHGDFRGETYGAGCRPPRLVSVD
jgi:hypothetical protein